MPILSIDKANNLDLDKKIGLQAALFRPLEEKVEELALSRQTHSNDIKMSLRANSGETPALGFLDRDLVDRVHDIALKADIISPLSELAKSGSLDQYDKQISSLDRKAADMGLDNPYHVLYNPPAVAKNTFYKWRASLQKRAIKKVQDYYKRVALLDLAVTMYDTPRPSHKKEENKDASLNREKDAFAGYQWFADNRSAKDEFTIDEKVDFAESVRFLLKFPPDPYNIRSVQQKRMNKEFRSELEDLGATLQVLESSLDEKNSRLTAAQESSQFNEVESLRLEIDTIKDQIEDNLELQFQIKDDISQRILLMDDIPEFTKPKLGKRQTVSKLDMEQFWEDAEGLRTDRKNVVATIMAIGCRPSEIVNGIYIHEVTVQGQKLPDLYFQVKGAKVTEAKFAEGLDLDGNKEAKGFLNTINQDQSLKNKHTKGHEWRDYRIKVTTPWAYHLLEQVRENKQKDDHTEKFFWESALNDQLHKQPFNTKGLMFVTTNLEKNVFVRPFKDENERQSRSAKAITSMFQNIANKSHEGLGISPYSFRHAFSSDVKTNLKMPKLDLDDTKDALTNFHNLSADDKIELLKSDQVRPFIVQEVERHFELQKREEESGDDLTNWFYNEMVKADFFEYLYQSSQENRDNIIDDVIDHIAYASDEVPSFFLDGAFNYLEVYRESREIDFAEQRSLAMGHLSGETVRMYGVSNASRKKASGNSSYHVVSIGAAKQGQMRNVSNRANVKAGVTAAASIKAAKIQKLTHRGIR